MRTSQAAGTRAFVNQFMIYALVAIFGSASIGLGTVWMRHQISVAANENKVLEASIAEAERRIEETEAAMAAEQDPDVLLKRNQEWRLGLVPPAETQVQRIPGDPVLRLASIHNRQLFGEESATVTLRVALAH